MIWLFNEVAKSQSMNFFYSFFYYILIDFLSGVHSGVETHVPFPNTIVKDSSGDGTALRESSTMPGFFKSISNFKRLRSASFLKRFFCARTTDRDVSSR